MVPKIDEFQKKLLATFQVEAGEHLNALSSGLIALEQSPSAENASHFWWMRSPLSRKYW